MVVEDVARGEGERAALSFFPAGRLIFEQTDHATIRVALRQVRVVPICLCYIMGYSAM